MKLRPSDDDQVPFPGAQVNPHRDDEPVIVDDDLRERYPRKDLEDVLVVHEMDYTFGRGIGAEPDGYLCTKRVTTERTGELCECGCDEVRVSFSQDKAGIAGGKSETCTRCGKKREEEMWA